MAGPKDEANRRGAAEAAQQLGFSLEEGGTKTVRLWWHALCVQMGPVIEALGPPEPGDPVGISAAELGRVLAGDAQADYLGAGTAFGGTD